MYGPFWIYATVVFLLGYAGSVHRWFIPNSEFEYSATNITTALSIVFGVGYGVPIVLSFIMKYVSDTELKFKEVTCIYGYSFSSI